MIYPGLLACLLAAAGGVALDNAYVKVSRNQAPCASASIAGCRDRVVVALGEVELETSGPVRRMARGDVAVFVAGQSYRPPQRGEYLEVAFKPEHPPVDAAAVRLAPEKNRMLYDGVRFFVFEELLEPGETRARHSHSQRVVIVLNETELRQWPDGGEEIVRKQVPDDVRFNAPVVHVVKTVGPRPLRNIVIELKPATDLLAGNWTANILKSKRDPNHQFQSATLRIEVAGNVVRITSGGVSKTGKAVKESTLELRLDGKERPLPAVPGAVIVTRRLQPRGIEMLTTKDGAVVARGIYEVSGDAQTLTAKVSGTDAAGRPFESEIVFERQ